MRFILWGLTLLTLIAMIGLFLIMQFTSPRTDAGQLIPINLFYFFLAFFLSLCGIATLVLYFVSSLRLKGKREVTIAAVHRPKIILRRSMRQAILFSLVVTAVFLLRSLGFANPLNYILIISAAVLIEVYFFGH